MRTLNDVIAELINLCEVRGELDQSRVSASASPGGTAVRVGKSAQEKFNEYLQECHETTDAVNEAIGAMVENYGGSCAYAAGHLSQLLQEAIGNLPRAKRAEFRARLYKTAQRQKDEFLIKTLKKVDQ